MPYVSITLTWDEAKQFWSENFDNHDEDAPTTLPITTKLTREIERVINV